MTRIRTHDRGTFKKCQTLWWYTSFNGLNLQPVITDKNLGFGTAIHEGLRIMYDVKRQDDPEELLKAEAIAAFVDSLRNSGIADHLLFDLEALGVGMLSHYWEWRKEADKDWEIVRTEVPFSVPIPVDRVGAKDIDNVTFVADPADGRLYLAEKLWDETLKTYMPEPVFYEGQLDIVAKYKRTGKLWIWDHKTTATINVDGYGWLPLDPQVGTYFWVAKEVLHLDIEGILFNFLGKYVPKEPALVYKGKALSKAHDQRTTKQLYIKAIQDNGFDYADYHEFLMAYEEPTYFHREEVFPTNDELAVIERDIVNDATAIINAKGNYSVSPSSMNCRGCAFQQACKIRQYGGDVVQWLTVSGLYSTNKTYGAIADD